MVTPEPPAARWQFDNGPGFREFRILGFSLYNGWHNITLWDPRTNRLGPSQGYTAGVSENPSVAGPRNFQRRALPAPTSDGTIGDFPGGLVVETLLGEWPEGGKSAANGRSDKSLTNITDPDGSYRPADAWLGPDANPYRNLGDERRRPIVLQRPFRTVGELGYVFRDVPWKTLSFFDESSGDAGLLDFFSVNDEAALTDGRVAMNTRNAVVLQALIAGIGRNPDGTDGVSLAASAAIADELRTNAFLNGDALPTIPQNVADVARLLTKDRLASLTETIKSRREFVARALAGSVQTRTWNIFIDTVAQTGTFPPGPGRQAQTSSSRPRIESGTPWRSIDFLDRSSRVRRRVSMNRRPLSLKMKRLPWALLVAGVLCPAWAAPTEVQVPPEPPFVRNPYPGSQWSLEIVQRESGAVGEPEESSVTPKQVSIKFGRNEVLHGTVSYSDGSQTEFYAVGEVLLSPARNTGRILVRSGASNSPFALEVPGFPGTRWLTRDNYSGREEHDGIAYDRFETTKPVTGDYELDEAVTALIEVDSRYPKVVNLPGRTYVFSPVTAFAETVDLPDDYEAAWNKRSGGRTSARNVAP